MDDSEIGSLVTEIKSEKAIVFDVFVPGNPPKRSVKQETFKSEIANGMIYPYFWVKFGSTDSNFAGSYKTYYKDSSGKPIGAWNVYKGEVEIEVKRSIVGGKVKNSKALEKVLEVLISQ